MTFSEKLRNIRKEKGFSQKEVAEKLSVSQPSYAQYENGKRNPKWETIRKIAEALGVNTGDLVDDWMDFSIEDLKKDFDNNTDYDGDVEMYLLEKEISSLDGLIEFLSFHGVGFDKEKMEFIFEENGKHYKVNHLGILSDIAAKQIRILIEDFHKENL